MIDKPKETGVPLPRVYVEEREAPPLTLRQLFWRRFRRHKMALFGIIDSLGQVEEIGFDLVLIFGPPVLRVQCRWQRHNGPHRAV